MLRANNPRIDTAALSARIQRLREGMGSPPDWPGERRWVESLEGASVALGATHHRRAPVPSDANTLLQLRDSDFVDAAYQALLGRLPNQIEYYGALSHLNAGEPRESLLLTLEALARKSEAEPAAVGIKSIPGMRRVLLLARMSRLRKVGRLVRWSFALLRLDRLREWQERLAHLQDARYRMLLDQLRHQSRGINTLQRRVTELEADNDTLHRQQARRPVVSDASGPPPEGRLAGETDFYRALEARFRGSPQSILALKKEHLERVRGVTPLEAGKPLLDLGCGRGEWLKLLQEEGIDALGVDLNAANVRAAAGEGLQVHYQDAIEALHEQNDDSLGMVTSFHLIEHLPMDTLRRLFAEAWRALAPGGRLLLETPNPQNLIVGSCNFYLDPTHVRPIPPDLLAFLAEFSGFVDVQILPLHPVAEAERLPGTEETTLRLNHYLYGPQDYALMAGKPAPALQESEA
ncbi:methyltransferase domain-containing protein [Modicisalibacter sp. 'Wilcox']|uniref:methyltransferase domain-containing protein n=1 Tax=Modicisalibacter sp. 'Wilcox' TaxID=2679914 RepID=UPI0013D580FF|nr:methyltransferase domain-containing protein [Modicisalibacter sp. 'Wilcox']